MKKAQLKHSAKYKAHGNIDKITQSHEFVKIHNIKFEVSTTSDI